jgi:outer membrane protein assembly factor BamB
MNINRSIWILFSVPFLLVMNGCHKGLLQGNPFFGAQATMCWGGDSQRRGESSEEISPPLKLVWTYKANSALGRAIVSADTFLFFGTKDGRITLIEMKTGKRVKTLKIQKKVGVSCVVEKNRLVVVQRWGEPSLRSIELLSGKTLWKQNLGPIEGEPLVLGHRISVGNEWGEVFTVDSKTGDVLWKRDLGDPVRGSIAQIGETLFVATEEGSIWSLSLVDGKIKWRQKLPGSLNASPVLTDERVFIGIREGTFYSLSQVDGSVVWEYEGNGGIYETAAVAGGLIYFGTTQGILYCLNVDDGRENWRFKTESVIGTSPFYGLQRETGEEEWRFEARGRIRSSPIVWKGMLIFSSEDRFVYGFIEEK